MKRNYKQLLSFFFLLLFFTGCSSLEDFNKGLNGLNQKLSSITGVPVSSGSSGSSAPSGGKVVALNINTGGKGKFENFKVRVTENSIKGQRLYFSGFYTNTSKKTQDVGIEFDVIDKNGVRKRGESGIKGIYIHDIRPGEKINIERDMPDLNLITTNSGETINLNSMRAYYR